MKPHKLYWSPVVQTQCSERTELMSPNSSKKARSCMDNRQQSALFSHTLSQKARFPTEQSDSTSFGQESQKREHTQYQQGRQSTYVFEGGVGSSTGSCFLQVFIPVEVCILNAGALICSKGERRNKQQKEMRTAQNTAKEGKSCIKQFNEKIAIDTNIDTRENRKLPLKICSQPA